MAGVHTENMAAGGIKGLLVWGMNPAVSSNNLNHTYADLDKLEWLVTFGLFESDTAASGSAPAPPPRISGPRSSSPFGSHALEKEGSPATAAPLGPMGLPGSQSPQVTPKAFSGMLNHLAARN